MVTISAVLPTAEAWRFTSPSTFWTSALTLDHTVPSFTWPLAMTDSPCVWQFQSQPPPDVGW